MAICNCKQLQYLLALLMLVISSASVTAQWSGREELLAAVEKTFGNPPETVRLTPKERVWIDRKKHRVIVDGYIALQEGQLELLACPASTKEHEAVVGLFAKAVTIHAGLLAVGAETGKPAKWDPEYAPPTGSEIQIQAYWKDEEDKPKTIDARKWVRDLSGKDKHLEPNWVFAGSGFWEDPDTKQKVYNAESGDLICVSNFSTAALDIPVKSTQANSGLLFIAYTDNIPKIGTPIRLVLQVVMPKDAKPSEAKPIEAKPSEAKPDDSKPAESKPTEAKTSESKASESNSGGNKASEPKPDAAKSGGAERAAP
ncbi:MAG: YdjY domain-containing protein [Pirellulales bacterium]